MLLHLQNAFHLHASDAAWLLAGQRYWRWVFGGHDARNNLRLSIFSSNFSETLS